MSDEVAAFDAYGNRLVPVTINTICPVEMADEGRAVCWQFMEDCEDAETPPLESILDRQLLPVNGFDATHVFCSRSAYSHQVERLWGYMTALKREDVSPGISSLRDEPREIKSRLSVLVGDKDDVLRFLGLREAV